MPFNGSGTFTLTYTWATEALSPPIALSKLDTQEIDIASGLSNCLTRDGQGKPSAHIDWNDKKITNLADAAAAKDALNRQSGDARYFELTDRELTDPTLAVGFLDLPPNAQNGDYTFVLTDRGKDVQHNSGSAHAYTIPPNSSVAFPLGTVLVASSFGAGTLTVAQGSGVTIRLAGTSSTGTRTIAQYGYVALTKKGTNEWWATGPGVS